MKDLNVTIDAKAKTLTIVIPIDMNPAPSATGKTLLVASTHGGIETDVKISGQNLRLNVNAYIYAHPKLAKGAAEEKSA